MYNVYRAPFCINPRTTAEKTGSCCLQFVVTACSYWYCSGNSAGQWRLCKPTFFTILLEICKHKLRYNTIQITIINPDSINCNKKVNKVKWSRSVEAIIDKSHWLNLVQCVWDICLLSAREELILMLAVMTLWGLSGWRDELRSAAPVTDTGSI